MPSKLLKNSAVTETLTSRGSLPKSASTDLVERIPVRGQSALSPLRKTAVYVSTALGLGITNVARALTYRMLKRAGLYCWLLPAQESQPLRLDLRHTPSKPSMPDLDRSVLREADGLLNGEAKYFSAHLQNVGNPPNWFLNPFSKVKHPYPMLHWSKIADFSAEAGDIKTVWELSRFNWAPLFARAFRVSQDPRYSQALESWLEDWWQKNPPNVGPNWLCAQEASIRLINTLLAFHLLGEVQNLGPGLGKFVEAHCRRIDATTSYAMAQDNNHATSEAAALFIGGTWLTVNGVDDAKGWAHKGRKLLNRHAKRLIMPDGSFSQHSITYHRVLLDTMSTVEVWRRRVGHPPFSQAFYGRAAAATRWLGAMIDPASGDGPNLGANDGANPYRLDSSNYRDFRPCLQLASRLFLSRPALDPGPWDEPSFWLAVSTNTGQPWLSGVESALFPDGGYTVLRNAAGVRAILRTPQARFRPLHADALHLDIWFDGRNIVRDGGTYSYADDPGAAEELASVVGHSTAQFDDRDQMVRMGRFLYGGWIQVQGDAEIATNGDAQSWTARLQDSWGAAHQRTVILKNRSVSIHDCLQEFKQKAVLRWRLLPEQWAESKGGFVSPVGRITVKSSVPITRMRVVNGTESRHYRESTTLPVLEVEVVKSPANLETTIDLI